MPIYSKLSLRILDAKYVKIYYFFHACHRNHPSYFPSFDPSVNTV